MEFRKIQEMIKGQGRKRLAVIAACVCGAAILTGGTLAYFTAEETAYNVITTGTLDLILHDETTGGEPFPEEGIHDVVPGNVVDKVVYIENGGTVDFYTRISLDKIIEAAEGVAAELNFDHITLDINTANWTEQDGFYYYNEALAPGEKTEPLFTTVTFEKEMGNDYMNAYVEIDVNTQAVQSKNNGETPFEATGWTE